MASMEFWTHAAGRAQDQKSRNIELVGDLSGNFGVLFNTNLALILMPF